jgi:hypothetical protein
MRSLSGDSAFGASHSAASRSYACRISRCGSGPLEVLAPRSTRCRATIAPESLATSTTVPPSPSSRNRLTNGSSARTPGEQGRSCARTRVPFDERKTTWHVDRVRSAMAEGSTPVGYVSQWDTEGHAREDGAPLRKRSHDDYGPSVPTDGLARKGQTCGLERDNRTGMAFRKHDRTPGPGR